MTEIQLMAHIQRFVTIQLQGKVFTYDASSKTFTSKDNVRMSLDYAISHCKEIKEGWYYKAPLAKELERALHDLTEGEICVIAG